MLEPTITQNSALYFAQHQASKRRKQLFPRRSAAARKEDLIVRQQRAFENVFLWRLLQRADKL